MMAGGARGFSSLTLKRSVSVGGRALEAIASHRFSCVTHYWTLDSGSPSGVRFGILDDRSWEAPSEGSWRTETEQGGTGVRYHPGQTGSRSGSHSSAFPTAPHRTACGQNPAARSRRLEGWRLEVREVGGWIILFPMDGVVC